VNSPKIAQTSASANSDSEQPAQAQKDGAAPNGGVISGAPKLEPQGQKVVGMEERVEYRDQDGNLLDEEQVKELEGKVEFKTRYETKTRLVDVNGNEVAANVNDGNVVVEGVAPPHPDVEGVDPATKKGEIDSHELKREEIQESREGEVEKEAKSAKPASESKEATV
jgi:dolichyl-phosphate-mannose-protein mannosyltransferase